MYTWDWSMTHVWLRAATFLSWSLLVTLLPLSHPWSRVRPSSPDTRVTLVIVWHVLYHINYKLGNCLQIWTWRQCQSCASNTNLIKYSKIVKIWIKLLKILPLLLSLSSYMLVCAPPIRRPNFRSVNLLFSLSILRSGWLWCPWWPPPLWWPPPAPGWPNSRSSSCSICKAWISFHSTYKYDIFIIWHGLVPSSNVDVRVRAVTCLNVQMLVVGSCIWYSLLRAIICLPRSDISMKGTNQQQSLAIWWFVRNSRKQKIMAK